MLSKILFSPVLLLADIIISFAGSAVRALIDADCRNSLNILCMGRTVPEGEKVTLSDINFLLLRHKPFRSVLMLRLGNRPLLRALLGCSKTIEYRQGVSIGGGMHIAHNVASINPFSAGENVFFGQGCVVGIGKDSYGRGRINPVLGSNSYIGANAVVFNGITVGDNVSIGAGAVVNRDVPSDSIVFGNPMQIRPKKGDDV